MALQIIPLIAELDDMDMVYRCDDCRKNLPCGFYCEYTKGIFIGTWVLCPRCRKAKKRKHTTASGITGLVQI